MRNKKKTVIGIIAGFFVAAWLLSSVMDSKPLEEGQTRKIQVDRSPLTVRVAAELPSQTTGLAGSQPLDDLHGLLFVYDQPRQQSYWMKGVTFPIDIIWIRGDTVSDISPNVPIPPAGAADESLPKYVSPVPVDRVLEVKAGWAAANGIQPGDPIKIR